MSPTEFLINWASTILFLTCWQPYWVTWPLQESVLLTVAEKLEKSKANSKNSNQNGSPIEYFDLPNHHPWNSFWKINNPQASHISKAGMQAAEVNAKGLFRVFRCICPPFFPLSYPPWTKDWSVVFPTQQPEMLVSSERNFLLSLSFPVRFLYI